MVLRFLFLTCLMSVPLLSLSQSGEEKSRVADTEPAEAVSKTGIIYVVGDVHKPKGVAMKDTSSITVLQALAIAEGTNPTASLHRAKILREGEYGPTAIPVDIRKILQAKAPDVTLKADDILFVPHGTGKLPEEHLYDAPPSVPLQGPIYNR
jgi:polysaccharide biosynthesis/export protein